MTLKFTHLMLPFRPANWLLFLISLLLISLTFALLLAQPSFPPQLPLWYSRPWGEDRLATPNTLYVVPSLGLVFLLINHYLANIYKGSSILSKILLWTALLTTLIGLVAVYKVLIII